MKTRGLDAAGKETGEEFRKYQRSINKKATMPSKKDTAEVKEEKPAPEATSPLKVTAKQTSGPNSPNSPQRANTKGTQRAWKGL